jgi:glycosyltransferase involved in cell wall biosynthesis
MSSAFEVHDMPFIWRQKWQVPILMVTQAFRLLFTKWKVVVVQFGGYHALVPAIAARITGRSCVIITGGTDCVSFPSISYGNFARQPLAWITRRAYAIAHVIIPVHASLVHSTNTYQVNDPQAQGIRAFMPMLRTPIHVVHNGYSALDWQLGQGSRDIDVISVASGDRRPTTLSLKGIDQLIDAARAKPDLKFVVIGLEPAAVDIPGNIDFLGPVANGALAGYYQRAKVYAQLSLSEGFPNALCEAMLCGCIPLVSAVGAMPDIVGASGGIIPRRDKSLLLRTLDALIAGADNDKARRARARIAENYPEERRAQELNAIIAGTLR